MQPQNLQRSEAPKLRAPKIHLCLHPVMQTQIPAREVGGGEKNREHSEFLALRADLESPSNHVRASVSSIKEGKQEIQKYEGKGNHACC